MSNSYWEEIAVICGRDRRDMWLSCRRGGQELVGRKEHTQPGRAHETQDQELPPGHSLLDADIHILVGQAERLVRGAATELFPPSLVVQEHSVQSFLINFRTWGRTAHRPLPDALSSRLRTPCRHGPGREPEGWLIAWCRLAHPSRCSRSVLPVDLGSRSLLVRGADVSDIVEDLVASVRIGLEVLAHQGKRASL